jgi:hypothetical protein
MCVMTHRPSPVRHFPRHDRPFLFGPPQR